MYVHFKKYIFSTYKNFMTYDIVYNEFFDIGPPFKYRIYDSCFFSILLVFFFYDNFYFRLYSFLQNFLFLYDFNY